LKEPVEAKADPAVQALRRTTLGLLVALHCDTPDIAHHIRQNVGCTAAAPGYTSDPSRAPSLMGSSEGQIFGRVKNHGQTLFLLPLLSPQDV